jgi:hypothetical protein
MKNKTTPRAPALWLCLPQATYFEAANASSSVNLIQTGNGQFTLTISHVIKNPIKHAFNYLTYYSSILPHSFALQSTPETVDALRGTGATNEGQSLFNFFKTRKS